MPFGDGELLSPPNRHTESQPYASLEPVIKVGGWLSWFLSTGPSDTHLAAAHAPCGALYQAVTRRLPSARLAQHSADRLSSSGEVRREGARAFNVLYCRRHSA